MRGPQVVIKFNKLYVWGRSSSGKMTLVRVPDEKVAEMRAALAAEQRAAIAARTPAELVGVEIQQERVRAAHEKDKNS